MSDQGTTAGKALNTSRSNELFPRARESLVGGVNSPVRAFKSVGLQPLFIDHGKGSHIWDIDGNEFIDYVGSWGPLILGHANSHVLDAVRKTLDKGTSFGAPTEAEVLLAEKVKKAVPSLELVRFVNSGNEAAQGAIRVARGFTGREKVIKFAGCYHGSVDSLLVKAGSGATTLGVPDSAGIPKSFAETTLVSDFNNLQSVIDHVEEYPGEIAAIILEFIPGNMGVITPELTFLRGLRDLCDREGILLISDEVMTGFRVALGGAQSLFDITPDLTIFGKVIGGGFPVGAYGGRRDIMSKVAPEGPVYQGGTLSGNPVAMAAGLATMEVLEDPAVFTDLAEKARLFTEGLEQAASANNVPLQTVRFGAMMGFFFSDKPVRNYDDATACDTARYSKFFKVMLENGVYLAPSAFEASFVSTAHTEEDLRRTAQAAGRAMASL
ncbi:MAG: glutamate-1-semialdehyde 2,1-aminomutase [Deltaproteobacteria bacterium]|nr:glutamate-1-semialdehyde 2,1-aminomutase [Deltaproteobacteria bacterium]